MPEENSIAENFYYLMEIDFDEMSETLELDANSIGEMISEESRKELIHSRLGEILLV